jgi:hypothetical protein
MQLKRSTWLLILLATILAGWVYFYEIREETKRTQVQVKQQHLFNFSEAAIKTITISKFNQTLEFVRTGNSNQSWQMKQPHNTPANDGTVSFLVDLLINSNRDRAFFVPTNQVSQYGLDKPLAKITVQLTNGDTHTLILGKSDFTGESVYAQIDPSSSNHSKSDVELALVSKNWQYAVERQLTEWKQ